MFSLQKFIANLFKFVEKKIVSNKVGHKSFGKKGKIVLLPILNVRLASSLQMQGP